MDILPLVFLNFKPSHLRGLFCCSWWILIIAGSGLFYPQFLANPDKVGVFDTV